MFSVSLHSKLNAKAHTDEEILEIIKKNANEGELFEHIYTRWDKKIYSYIMTILNYNSEDANEIVGDVFIALYEYNKNHTINSCKSFLYTTAHNKSIDLIRKKSELYTTNNMEEQVIDHENDKHKSHINLSYQQKLMQTYLGFLQPKEREIIHLFYFEDQSYEEIAQYLGSNKNTIGTMILQAKKKLKELIERDGSENILAD